MLGTYMKYWVCISHCCLYIFHLFFNRYFLIAMDIAQSGCDGEFYLKIRLLHKALASYFSKNTFTHTHVHKLRSLDQSV